MNFIENIKKNIPIFEGKIQLKELNIDDFLRLREAINNEPASKLSCRPIHLAPLDDAIKHFKNCCIKTDSFSFAIYKKSTEELLGRVSLFDYNPRNRTVELGYFIFKEYRNQKYGSDLLNGIIRLCFDELNINKILAQTGSFNESSIRLLEKFGFTQTGILKEHHEINGILLDDYVYSYLKSEYKKT